jgi:sugar phosphate isomerase/epimerase
LLEGVGGAVGKTVGVTGVDMIARRELLKSAAMMAAGRALSASDATQLHFGCQTNAWPIAARDFANVLAVIRKIKDYGYDGFETGFANVEGQFGHAAAEARRQIGAIGARFFGVHIFLTQYDSETHVAPPELYERVAAGGAKLGAERLILSGTPPADEAGRKRKAEALNRAGAFAAKLGLKLSYHNHGPEVQQNGAELEFLMRETNPAEVWFLLDAGHAFEAGADVLELVRRYHGRLTGMHLRDFKNGEQVPLGSGDFPLQAVAEAIRQTGWSGWVLNEEERLTSKPGDSAVKPACDALFRAFGRQSKL